jgi:hypothetical protein
MLRFRWIDGKRYSMTNGLGGSLRLLHSIHREGSAQNSASHQAKLQP